MSSRVLHFGLLATLAVALAGAAAPHAIRTPAGGGDATAAPTRISSEEAIARALNDVSAGKRGFVLRHPRHHVRFGADGLLFRPRNGGPAWQWRLETAPIGVKTGPGRPLWRDTEIVYRRGALTERYLLGAESIEQQFVLRVRPVLHGRDLVIGGRVESAGSFRRTSDGWLWQTKRGGVRLGDVTVFDARGTVLPARMIVTPKRTRIVVPETALARAVYPVTIDPEIGANDFRISDMGPPDTVADAFQAAVTYNPTNNEYLVVWAGDETSGGLADGELEIFGQRLDGTTGAEIGANDFRISDAGPDGNATFDAFNPAATHNPTTNEYLVVWEGDDNTGGVADEEFEIYGQRLSAAGAEIGTNDFRISDMGPDGNTNFDATNPAVARTTTGQYLVVWDGDDNAAPLVDNENEIFGQRLTAAGIPLAPNDFRISDMGPDGNASFDAFDPAVTHNGTQYLVVWSGDDNTAPLVEDEFEIFGQRLTTTGLTGTNDFRISNMGFDGSASFDAFDPAVAHNTTDNEYLVVWSGDDDTPPLVDNETEIYGQRLTGLQALPAGTNDFRISDMGPDGNPSFAASRPAVAYNATSNDYVVVWEGDDNSGALVDNELEIFEQRLSATGGEIFFNDLRISDMGPNGTVNFAAFLPAVAYNAANESLVVWRGEDDTPPLVDNEFEIFEQRLAASGGDVAPNDLRISDMGPADLLADAVEPAVAYNSTNDEYLVVWAGNDATAPLAANETEIFGQRLNAGNGTQVGVNDFRISDMGPDGNASFGAASPAVAYNATDNEYLVVWMGDGGTAVLVDNEFEIYGQRVTASGAEVGANDIPISRIGPTGNASFDGFDPAVAYNATNDEYLVVWSADPGIAPLVDNENEIFGQRIDALTGSEEGTDDFRISDAGGDGNAAFAASRPAVAYNPTANEYLVVWEGDDNTGTLVDDELEIFAQRLTATGGSVGPNDARITDMGTDRNTAFGAFRPAVAYNPTNNQYLVVWHGDDDTAPRVDEEFEVFGQRLTGALGGVAPNDFQISDMGPAGNPDFDAFEAAVAYNAANNEYLVVWRGDDGRGTLVDGEFEIFGERLNAASVAPVEDDFRLSDMGPDGTTSFLAFRPAIAFRNSVVNVEYLVVWDGDDNTPPLVDQESEIFGQRFATLGVVTTPGTFTLAPAEVTVDRHQPVTFELVWTTPGVWRDLATIDLRVVGGGGEPLIWLRWEEAPNTFSLFRAGQFRHPLSPGGHGRHETPWASLPLADTAVIGSGPTGQTVTLRLPLSFKPKAAGGTYRIEVAATDDFGNTQDFELAGTVRVTR